MFAGVTRWKAALAGLARDELRLIYPDACRLCHGEAAQTEDDYIGDRCLVPVPLHEVHSRERGFNQARQLCHNLGRATGLKIEIRAVKRIRVTRIQTLIARSERMVKMLVAFAPYRQKLNGRQVVLVDDVLTTGATTSDCSRACKKAGAAEVGVWTLAHGLISPST